MVIKKPYAFLIKHFRLVHGLLFVLIAFLTAKSFSIYSFFNSYAQNHTYVNSPDLASSYVNLPMYLVAILAALLSLIIYFLLSMKRKSNIIYLLSVVYYVLLIIFFFYISTVFTGLQSKSLDVETVRIYRDISLIVLVPQIILMFIIFGRALGFNLKQFDFKKDLEELEIDVTDSEEVELTFGNDSYKVSRFIRKFLRYTKYFFLENKLFVIVFSSIIIFGISLYTYSQFSRIQKSYEESQDLNISSLSFNVKSSYITNVDLNNNVINQGYHYILVDLVVKNKVNRDYALTRESFRLEVNNELLVPSFRQNKEFLDLGTVFNPTDLGPGEEREFIIVFQINSSDIKKDYLFKIKNYTGANDIKYEFYKEVVIKPENLNVNKEIASYKLPSGDISLSDSLLKNTVVKVDSYDVSESFKENYTYKVGNETKNGVYSIIPFSTNKAALVVLKLKGSISVDEEASMSKYIKIPADLFEKYGIIRYRYQGTFRTSKLTQIKVEYEKDNYSYLEVPREVQYADNIELILLIRGRKYTIALK